MSLSISGVHSVIQGPAVEPLASHASTSPAHSASAKPTASTRPSAPASTDSAAAIPTLTVAEEAQKLASSGLSKEQIATTLGLSLTQVLTSLHENTPTTQSSAADLEALSARLSVTA